MKISSNQSILAIAAAAFIFVLSGCAKVKEKSEMTLDELKTKATVLLKQKDYEDAAEYLQLIITKFPDHPKLANYKISLANCKFNNGDYESAYQLYENFHLNYPSDKRAEYAKYKAAMAKFKQVKDFERDQKATEATLQVCKNYTDVPLYQKYKTQIDAIHQACLHKLIQKELHICKFYIKHGKHQAAAKRIELFKKLYGDQKEFKDQLLFLECKLASKSGNESELSTKIDALTKNHPESPYIKLTENLVKKPDEFFF